MKTPDKVSYIGYMGNCISLSPEFIKSLEHVATKANKRKVNRLVKIHFPELYESLALNFYNPYNYYKTDKYIILVHSLIEYVFKYEL